MGETGFILYLNLLQNKITKWLSQITFTEPVASLLNVSPVLESKQCFAKIDSGATHTYIKQNHSHLLKNKITLSNGPSAYLPNKQKIKATAQGVLPLHPTLSQASQTALVFPQLTNESLISVGQLCDDNCIVKFDKKTVTVHKNNKLILHGNRCYDDKLYNLNISNISTPT